MWATARSGHFLVEENLIPLPVIIQRFLTPYQRSGSAHQIVQSCEPKGHDVSLVVLRQRLFLSLHCFGLQRDVILLLLGPNIDENSSLVK